MKTNHINQKTRLNNRIQKLLVKLDNSWRKFQNPLNPYRCCNGCDKAEPEISISGHGKSCWVNGIINEIKHYKNILNQTNN